MAIGARMQAFLFASVLIFVNEPAATGYECQNRDTGVVDLTFASVQQRVLKANVKSKTTPETYIC